MKVRGEKRGEERLHGVIAPAMRAFECGQRTYTENEIVRAGAYSPHDVLTVHRPGRRWTGIEALPHAKFSLMPHVTILKAR